MKKWEKPELGELALENTKESDCKVDFNSEVQATSALPFGCTTGGYKPGGGITGTIVCVYYKCGKCTYVSKS